MCTIRKNLILLFLLAFLIFTIRAYGYEILRSDQPSYQELHWDDSSLPIPYIINSAGTSDIDDSGDYSDGEFEAIRSAFQIWEEVPTSYICFSDYGIISRTITNIDGINLLIWRESGWSYGQDAIALTSIWYDPLSGEIFEADIEFNGINFEWTIIADGPSTCPENLMDVQNIATHEIGHTFGLADVYGGYEECTMYGYIESLCETKKRTLEPDDIAGVSYLYPAIVVSGITPSSGTNEDNFRITVTITGDILEDGATIKLTQDRRPDITVSTPTVISSSTISADLDLYGAPVGLWDVWVINPDGAKGFLSKGFEVIDGVNTNVPPVAIAGINQTVFFGKEVVLDGTGSYDPDGCSLTYIWAVSVEPEGSSISLSSPSSSYPEFTPTQGGTYKFKLVVDDGELVSEPDEVIITVYECTSGQCCDEGTKMFRPNTYICQAKVDTDYGCPWGTDNGDDVGVRDQNRYCSGASVFCDGALQWDSWTVYANCDSNEKCEDESSKCILIPEENGGCQCNFIENYKPINKYEIIGWLLPFLVIAPFLLSLKIKLRNKYNDLR